MSSAQLALTAAACGAVLLLAAGPGHRLSLWPYGAGLSMVLAAGVVGLVALATAGQTLAAARAQGTAPWLALAAAALALAVVAVPASWVARAVTAPWINDVATDPGDPPPLGRDGASPAADATLTPLTLDLPAARVLQSTRATAATLGWTVTDGDASPELVVATASTRWFGFVDDVIVRVRALDPNRTRVDVRSASRVGVSDLGTNARRIRRFLLDLRAAAARDAPPASP